MNLLSHPFFTPFSETHAKALAEYTDEFFCDEKTVLFQEGDLSQHIYLLLEGQVELKKRAQDGRQVTISLVNAGDHFGEMGILDEKPRSATAMSASFARVAKLPSTALLRILNEEPPYVTIQFFRTILDHLRKSNERYVEEIAKQAEPSKKAS